MNEFSLFHKSRKYGDNNFIFKIISNFLSVLIFSLASVYLGTIVVFTKIKFYNVFRLIIYTQCHTESQNKFLAPAVDRMFCTYPRCEIHGLL